MTTRLNDLMSKAKTRFSAISTSPSLDAQLLMAAVLNENRAHVIAHPEKPLTPEQVGRFNALVERRADGEPIAYLLGRRAFYDREMIVSPAVLVPRPETEHLIEAALKIITGRALTVVDVGTGSGAIAVTVKGNAPHIAMHAVDISAEALAIARKNADAAAADIRFYEGDLLAPLIAAGVRAGLVLANLPYIARDELNTLAVIKHEPRLALDGGPDGLDLFRRLFAQMPLAVTPGAHVLLEIGADQGVSVPTLAHDLLNVRDIRVTKDLAGHDRVVYIRLA